ncbi:glutathione S-transferase family protein [Roseovarius sp. MS2]|uniref:glutathione S-transferase family protein n=1 Tax=Roseovarius sp. MS2 TaxID=3390728 RepID=UPI003EDC2E20
MPTVYYAPAGCSLVPHIVQEWIGAPYKAVKVRVGSKELLAMNPAGTVPTCREDSGWLLTRAGAILDDLGQKLSEAGLSGGDSIRAKCWSAFLTSDLYASFWLIFMPKRHTINKSDAARKATVGAGVKLASQHLGIPNRHLGGRSVIDAYAFPMIRWGAKILPGGLQNFSDAQSLRDRIAAGAAVQKIIAREGSA